MQAVTIKTVKPLIRLDLFAVKQFCDDGASGAWCYVEICRSKESALAYFRSITSNIHRDFPLVSPVIVHPSQRVVDMFLSVGNKIKN